MLQMHNNLIRKAHNVAWHRGSIQSSHQKKRQQQHTSEYALASNAIILGNDQDQLPK
jgi:hypothetical protein